MRGFRILIIGFGNVGQAFFKLLNLKRDALGVNASVVEIIDRSVGTLLTQGQALLMKPVVVSC
ncbi:hypothetical protein [Vulcanisaeta sp. JCM 16161]|uniref:hypothetical protein n=1 Tax=Vulcanisaeta sp. JCM 16161 TaxID=1295372 RepID=UPI000A79B69B|nr:hypothetical protein [Vulcanisaeta sp. JCM 16161]